jgi:dihydrofolate synthase/folylpolyglutamate synthase
VPRTLDEWLEYQLTTHVRGVDLGLARVGEVWRRLGAPQAARVVVTVAGTNGKGSTVALIEAMARAAGHVCGAYTSPHLLRYNERVRIDGVDASDEALVAAFERIEAARGDLPLTYFEFGTLAALLLFADAALDLAILEVGLGGRLDAVNLVDADVAVITTIALDHQDWLGDDVDTIGREKAGVARAGRVAIVGEHWPPSGLVDELQRIGAQVRRAGRDYRLDVDAEGWHWRDGEHAFDMSAAALPAPCQPANAAAAIAALVALGERLPVDAAAIARGVADARVAARLQRFAIGRGELVVDVAHNPQAAGVLADWLRTSADGRRAVAVFGALADKDVAGIVAPLAASFAAWHLAGLEQDSPRGLDSQGLRRIFVGAAPDVAISTHEHVVAALDAALAQLRAGDRVVAFGSFFVASAALRWATERGLHAG